MAAAEEIPQLVRPEKKPHFDCEAPRHSPTQVASVAKVLNDDDLLREIIVRVGFPTTLVCAALVCKRWLGHASDPRFLSRFHKLHPPHLLGCYIIQGSAMLQRLDAPRFVPMLPQLPELAAVMRRLESYNFGAQDILDCRNGSVFTKSREGTRWTHGVHHPLRAEKGMQIIPRLPPPVQDHSLRFFSAIVSKVEGSSLSYLYVMGESNEEAEKSTVRVYMLQDAVWCMHTSATCIHVMRVCPEALLIGNKIYMPAANSDDIIVLDLTTSNFSTIQLPQGLKYGYFKSRLSRADDASSVYLIHVKKFQLRIWLHKGDNWILVDTICLREMLSTLGVSGHTLEVESNAYVHISQVGDNGQFVFLEIGQCIFYLDIKCRTLCKVYENTVDDRDIGSVHPFMMIWPPTFPALKDDPARNAM